MRLTAIELFCGAGGGAEGFRQAGFECLYGNDHDPQALETFRRNHPEAWADGRPIEEVDPRQVRERLGLKVGELSALSGGPPCQGFSINAPERRLDDPRNSLFWHYMRFVDEFEPETVVFENVPGILSLAGGLVFERVVLSLVERGYGVDAKVLFAAHYGVPQERWRLVLLGAKGSPPTLPPPTHFALGTANFKGGRGLTFQLEEGDRARLAPAVTVAEAIGDLPRLGPGQGAEVVRYDRGPHSDYARSMRNPEGVTYNHRAAKLSAANLERLRYVRPGGSWRDIPPELLPAGMKRAERSSHTKRYGRLKPDGLAATIMTKCSPHWGPVFLPDQDRTLTVREAARLQSFPDHYRFYGPRDAQYRQVGNAVPVLMARAIARSLASHLEGP